MNPGPEIDEVLNLQSGHRSELIWAGQECGTLVTRCHLKSLLQYVVDPEVAHFVSGTQFNGVARLCYVPLDADLITALVERWREETHTFHFPFGEVTITLQDVNVLFGLRVGGRPVTGTSDHMWADVLEEHFGVRPPPHAFDGAKLKLKWLRDTFQNCPRDDNGIVTEVVLHRYVRAYLLFLIGAVLFPDKSGSKVQLIYFPLLIDLNKLHEISWGSGVLAFLFRNLCNASRKGVTQIGGALLLLQFWSWERISIGRPRIVRSRVSVALAEGVEFVGGMGTQMILSSDPLGCKWLRIDRSYSDHRLGLVVYRDLFDQMNETQFIWMPYTPHILEKLGPICSEDPDEWIVKTPLICFDAVEWIFPERCVRQFGLHQGVPLACNTNPELHSCGRRGVGTRDWADYHKAQIALWDSRKTRMLPAGQVYRGFMDYDDNYLVWYRRITRLQISPRQASVPQENQNLHYYTPTSADYHSLTQMGVYTYTHARDILRGCESESIPLGILRSIKAMEQMSLQTLQNTRQAHLIENNEDEEISLSHETQRYDFRPRGEGTSTQELESELESSRSRRRKTRRQR